MNHASEPECPICDLVTGVHGAVILEDGLWSAGILPGLEVPGWIVLAQHRHAVGPASMEEVEAAELGPLLQRLSAAIEEVTEAERVYVVAYGENAPHWHLLLTPRGPDVPPEHRHNAMWNHRDEYLEPERAQEVGREIQRRLAKEPA